MEIGRLSARFARTKPARRPRPKTLATVSPPTRYSLWLALWRLEKAEHPAGRSGGGRASPATATRAAAAVRSRRRRCPSPSLFLYRARGGGWSELPAASGLCGACAGDAPRQWTAARPSAPEGGLSLSAVMEASSSTARVLRLVLRLTDTHRDREERARPETAAHYSGEPEASPVRFYSPFLS
jgi:hypothetical protein